METKKTLAPELAAATAAIERSPLDAGAYFNRAQLYYRASDFGNALNDIIKTLELDPDNAEARTYEKMIRDIFEYRYTDYYNP